MASRAYLRLGWAAISTQSPLEARSWPLARRHRCHLRPRRHLLGRHLCRRRHRCRRLRSRRRCRRLNRCHPRSGHQQRPLLPSRLGAPSCSRCERLHRFRAPSSRWALHAMRPRKRPSSPPSSARRPASPLHMAAGRAARRRRRRRSLRVVSSSRSLRPPARLITLSPHLPRR